MKDSFSVSGIIVAMRITIDNRIRIPLCLLKDEQVQQIKQAFTYNNPEYQKILGMGRLYVPRGIPKYLTTWEETTDEISIPRGALPKLREVLTTKFRITQRMSLGDPELAGQIPDCRISLRPYQIELKDVCIDLQTALVTSPQGSGKTTIGYAIAAQLKLPTLVVVPTERIFQQWVKGVEKNLGMDPNDVGIIQGATRRIRPLTVGMQQTLKNCASQYRDKFGVVIADEAQRFAATTFFDVIDVMPSVYRIGMTADERRADRKEFLVHDVMGTVAFDIDRQTLIDQGAIIDAEIRIVPSELKVDWYANLEPRKRSQGLVQDRLLNEIGVNEERNKLIMKILSWCVDEGHTTITLTWRRDHCATLNSLSLARGWDSGLLLGGKDSEAEFDRSESEMNEGVLKQAVGTYQAVGVGFNLPRVSRGIFAGPCASKQAQQQFGQYCGRYERPDEATGKVHQGDAIIYYVWDQHVYGLNPIVHIARWKPNVFVLHDGNWVPAKQFLKEERLRMSEAEEIEEVVGFESISRG